MHNIIYIYIIYIYIYIFICLILFLYIHIKYLAIVCALIWDVDPWPFQRKDVGDLQLGEKMVTLN